MEGLLMLAYRMRTKWNQETGGILLSDEELEKEVDRCKQISHMSLYRCPMAEYELSQRQLRDKINSNQDKKVSDSIGDVNAFAFNYCGLKKISLEGGSG